MYLIWILRSKLIRSNNQSRAPLWVLETCLLRCREEEEEDEEDVFFVGSSCSSLRSTGKWILSSDSGYSSHVSHGWKSLGKPRHSFFFFFKKKKMKWESGKAVTKEVSKVTAFRQ